MPVIRFFYKFNLSISNERLFLQYEGNFGHYSLATSNVYVDPVYEIRYLNDISYTRNSFNNAGLLKYEFPNGKIRPTLTAGAFINYSFITNYKQHTEIKFSWNDRDLKEETNTNPFSKIIFGMGIGLGLMTEIYDKQLFLDARYQRGYGLINGLDMNYLLLNLGLQINN